MYKRDQPKNPVDFWNSPSILNPQQTYPLEGNQRPIFKTPPLIYPIPKTPLEKLQNPDPTFTILSPQQIAFSQKNSDTTRSRNSDSQGINQQVGGKNIARLSGKVELNSILNQLTTKNTRYTKETYRIMPSFLRVLRVLRG